MAKNWTLKEAVEVITAGENKEALQEIAKRYPLTALVIAKIGINDGVAKLMEVMPDNVTMLKLERANKEGVAEDPDLDESEEAEDEAEVASEEVDINSLSSKKLYELCIKKGIKAKKYGVNKQYYIDLLQGVGEEIETETEEEADEPVEQDGPDYSEMSAVELFKLCKERKIKTQPKLKAKEYIKLLEAADAAEAEATGDTDDDDWDADEEEAPKSDKKVAKENGKKKPDKKPAKTDDEEDGEWDI